MVELTFAYNIVLGGILKGSCHVGDVGEDGRIILKLFLKKWVVRMWTGSIWIRIWASGRQYDTVVKLWFPK
jgi:hypothetical protein